MHADSISSANSIMDKDEFLNLRTRLLEQYDVKFTGKLISVPCDQQVGSINCGIFVLHFIESLICGAPLTSKCNPTFLRAKVFKALIEDAGNRL